MTPTVHRFAAIENRDGVVWIWLNRPDRHNSLVPNLISDLKSALADAAQQKPRALVVTAKGSSFSTGGDIAGFLDHRASLQDLKDYAQELVSGLHGIILDLIDFPAPVLAALNGPVTGGSVGLMLAADLVAMAEHAFLQPYYSKVGFGPDGGWTALLPDRIGTGRALEIQYRNERISAAEALRMGLVSAVCPLSELEAQISKWVNDLSEGSSRTHLATRRGVWDEARRETVRQRLDQEKDRFLELVALPETVDGMLDFTRKRA
ncbi:enoyl-CoA hydratase/isomerase family protein [uncultured Roseibium sp.]|uniref:enoyl-CoA hydratase/isomerase family protein n=1 Tax=uncultured Roseibium sp. TaxID=1936171 RepID=UPI0026117415|nr:enoyl-CoA hydratase/isomerase family protein [uncultured Roseibium sp.]